MSNPKSTSKINTNPDNITIHDLDPLVDLRQTGIEYTTTTTELGEKLTKLLQSMGMNNLDNVFFTARTAKDSVGVDGLTIKAYFSPQTGSSIYFKSGGGKDAVRNGTFQVIKVNNRNGVGPFGITDEFRSIMSPLCPDDPRDDNKVILTLNKQWYQGHTYAVLELDAWKTLAFMFGVGNNNAGVNIIKGAQVGETNHVLIISLSVNPNSHVRGKSSQKDMSGILRRQQNSMSNSSNRGY